MERSYLGTIYYSASERFRRGLFPIARCIKAETADLATIEVIELGRANKIKAKELGYIENGTEKHQSNTVYDTGAVSPTITTIQGGGTQQIKNADVKRLGNIYGFNGGNYAGNVFDKDKISPCLRTSSGGNVQPMIVETKCCAMRGRNPDNPSDRTAGIPTEQRLEVNHSAYSNCLTTVQKDNLVLEQAECLRMGRTEEGKRLRKDYESGNIHHGFNEHRQAKPKNGGICNTITTVQKDTEIIETKGFYDDVIVNDRGFINKEPQISKGIAPTLRAEAHGNEPKVIHVKAVSGGEIKDCEIQADIELSNPEFYNFLYLIDGKAYLIRIRKLTPLETWRLQNFNDEDFQKAKEVNSNSQLYKQSGNSICKAVLMAIFSQLNIQGIKPWNDMTVKERYGVINGN